MSSYPLTVAETCSCGARFEWTDDTGQSSSFKSKDAQAAIKEWRKSHRHEFRPLPSPPPPYVPPSTGQPPWPTITYVSDLRSTHDPDA
jgi:hypothetical protein